MEIEQQFRHYQEWEDWANGMWRDVTPEEDERFAALSRDLLLDTDRLEYAMRHIFEKWPTATLVNMTNRGQNRRAWLGQSACCVICESPEQSTRRAWGTLELEQKQAANRVATNIIELWETEYRIESQCQSVQLELMFGPQPSSESLRCLTTSREST